MKLCNMATKGPSEWQQLNGALIVWKLLNDAHMMPLDATEVSAVCVHHDKIVKKTGSLMRSTMSKGEHYQCKLEALTGHKVGEDAHNMLKWWPIYALINILCLFMHSQYPKNALLLWALCRFRPKSNFYQKFEKNNYFIY